MVLPWGPHSAKAMWFSLPPPPKSCGPLSLLHQSCVILSSPPKPHSPLSGMAAKPGFKSQSQSSSAAPFPTPPTISYTCQHCLILPALLGCHSKSEQVWPMAWSQSSPSSHTGAVTRGSCFPWVEVTPSSLAQSMATAI